ncbi:GntR family transcriptional regulator [Kaistia sp. 32K]|uniref:GntR family transcriptional regulator n=1 Tax=Kaistia sp. 32K TaxID=2795690 RepID=UPI001914FC77|nr:GntR family transcriptional regulator [Kaistia sp. 32K]BCP53635.1 GntR family transcriptional regulator [Kaistia sp. 32K]
MTQDDSSPQRAQTAGFEPLKHADLAEQTYAAIRRRILRRELETGQQIPIDIVAAELGVSRTPVLDALKRLASEGLVEIRARRGCYVRALTTDDIREIFEVREAIELYGVRAAIRDGRHGALADVLSAACVAMEAATEGDIYVDYDRFTEWDRAFHRAIVTASANRRLEEIYGNLHVHLHIMRVHYFRELEAAIRIKRDHRAILDAIRAGDLAAAQAAVSAHIFVTRDRIIANLARDGGRM